MRFLLCGINAKYIHSNLAIFSLKAYADRKKIPGAEIILKEYTITHQRFLMISIFIMQILSAFPAIYGIFLLCENWRRSLKK